MEEELKKSQTLLGKYVTSPALSDKLLHKPPLRFLHDVFVSVVNQHGVMAGLFDQDELSWTESVANDKDAKAFFIAKAINFISLACGANLPVRSAKICAGQEADKTNQLLQQLAVIIERKVDNSAVLLRVQNKEGPENLSAFAKGPAFLSVKPDPPKEPPMKAIVGTPAKREPDVVSKSKIPVPNTSRPPPATKTLETKAATTAPKKAQPEKTTALKVEPVRAVQKDKPKTPADDISSYPADKEVSEPTVQPPAVRPMTGRRAPQRPPTATAPVLVRRDTFVVEEEKEVEAPAPAGVRFLTEEEDQHTKQLLDDLENNGEFAGGGQSIQLGLYDSRDAADSSPSGQLVSHLRETQKALVESNGITEAEEAGNNVLIQQESSRFKRDIDDLRGVLQRVSRLTDILTSQMQILPEDFEEMEKDRQRYLEEIQVLRQQIEEALKLEETDMDKLRREHSFQEESLFVINEEIASTQYRIKEKTLMFEKLLRLATIAV